MKKRYTITYAYNFDVIVTIDHDIMTDEKLHEINNFWGGHEYRLGCAGANVCRAVLTMLALRAFTVTVTDLDPAGRLRRGEEEGWPPLDGSHGIELISLDYFELDSEEIDIKSEVVA